MNSAMSSIDEIVHEIDHVASMINAFRAAATGGDIVDLSGIDQRVETLCSNISLRRTEARDRLKSPLLALIDDLNRLVETLEVQQNEASETVKSISSRHRAVSAYGKGTDFSATGKKNKPR